MQQAGVGRRRWRRSSYIGRTSSAVWKGSKVSIASMACVFTSHLNCRSTILFGRTSADLLASVLCASIVCLTGYVIGWRPSNGVIGVISGLAIAVGFAYALSWFTACIGLRSSDPESAQAVGLLILFPLAFVSSCFVPTAGMPGWMRPIADWNPVSSVAGACREGPGRRVVTACIDGDERFPPGEGLCAQRVEAKPDILLAGATIYDDL